jgi:hypothetical protein
MLYVFSIFDYIDMLNHVQKRHCFGILGPPTSSVRNGPSWKCWSRGSWIWRTWRRAEIMTWPDPDPRDVSPTFFWGWSINHTLTISTSEKKWELCMIVPTICGDGPGGGSSWRWWHGAWAAIRDTQCPYGCALLMIDGFQLQTTIVVSKKKVKPHPHFDPLNAEDDPMRRNHTMFLF